MGIFQDLNAVQQSIETWYRQSSSMLEANHEAFMQQLRAVERLVAGETSPVSATENGLTQTPSGRAGLWADDNNAMLPFTKGLPYPPGFMDEEDSSGFESKLDTHLNFASHWLVVQFKIRKLLYGSNFPLKPGEYVVVGGDRGEDIGLVTEVYSDHELVPNGLKDGAGRALRQANPSEVQLLEEQRDAESQAVAWAQSATRKQALDMSIVDAEYQFDRRKLTFYYDSAFRPDFRSLVRELYQRFHARIWMEKAKG